MTTAVTDSTRRELTAARRLDTALGAAAMLAARRLDASEHGDETAAGVASLIREHRAALAEALKDADGGGDELDELRDNVVRLVQGGKP